MIKPGCFIGRAFYLLCGCAGSPRRKPDKAGHELQKISFPWSRGTLRALSTDLFLLPAAF
jgi:hypothetical protein